MVYDLVVVGNGVAAQTLLLELFSQLQLDVNKSQNFSVAQIYSEEITPACSLRSTATVSLSGIEEGISELGDDLRNSYFLFVDFVNLHNPKGVEKVKQLITFSNDEEKEKLLRRYKTLKNLDHSALKEDVLGIELDSYIISPDIYNDWFNEKLKNYNIIIKKIFLRDVKSNEDLGHDCLLMNGEIIKTKKIIFCTGAYAKIFSQFFNETKHLITTEVLSGAYLEKSIDLMRDSILITIDGHNLAYRNHDKKLIIGSASKKGAFFVSEHAELKKVFDLFEKTLKIDFGLLKDYKKIIGQRHKARKRKPVAEALNPNKTVYIISGLYKNGFSYSHLFAKKIVSDLLNQ